MRWYKLTHVYKFKCTAGRTLIGLTGARSFMCIALPCSRPFSPQTCAQGEYVNVHERSLQCILQLRACTHSSNSGTRHSKSARHHGQATQGSGMASRSNRTSSPMKLAWTSTATQPAVSTISFGGCWRCFQFKQRRGEKGQDQHHQQQHHHQQQQHHRSITVDTTGCIPQKMHICYKRDRKGQSAKFGLEKFSTSGVTRTLQPEQQLARVAVKVIATGCWWR